MINAIHKLIYSCTCSLVRIYSCTLVITRVQIHNLITRLAEMLASSTWIYCLSMDYTCPHAEPIKLVFRYPIKKKPA